MGNSSHFLPSCFKVFTKTAGYRKSDISEGNEKHARIQYPATLPEEIYRQRQFSLTEIKAATNNFHPISLIAEGFFGNVFKGILDDGNFVAVKRFFPDSVQDALNEFQAEVKLLCQLRHQHLVSLIGFCNDKDELILVYPLMKNGTLCDHLYGSGCDPLPWKQRLEICIGAARGLHYLHTGIKYAIIHSNVDSNNILLDDKWVSKLSSFGFSKMRPQPSYINTSKALKNIDAPMAGILGYVDPEYMRGCGLSEKSDVYSFGVVLFEVLCSRPVFDRRLDEYKQHLVYWVCCCIGDGTIYNIIDSYLKGKIAPECFKIFVNIAYCCISEKGDRRPDMGEVELMLELALEMQEKADSEVTNVDPYGECYWDPEYQRDGGLSEKCDVYSFGVVLFEVLCARPVIDRRLDEHKQHLVYWVCRCIGDGTIYNIIDSYLKGKIAPEWFKIFVDIAYCCISEKGDTRPEMGEVEMMLELALKMQEKADSEMKDVDPHGECTYGEVSFSIPVSDHSFPVDNSSPLESRW